MAKPHKVRLDLNGQLDELFVWKAFVHLERMDNNAWWIGIDLPDGRHIRLNFGAINNRAHTFMHLEEDWEGGKYYEGDFPLKG